MNTAISALVSFHTAICSGQTQGGQGYAFMYNNGTCIVEATGYCVVKGPAEYWTFYDGILSFTGKKDEFYRWSCYSVDPPEKPRRKYSVEEIDEMRDILMPPCPGQWSCTYSNSKEDVERQLRTYMLNGTSPQELRNKIESRRK